jgi:hypothetical protein
MHAAKNFDESCSFVGTFVRQSRLGKAFSADACGRAGIVAFCSDARNTGV